MDSTGRNLEGRSKVKGRLSLPPHSVSFGVSSSECFSSAFTPAANRPPPHIYWEIPSWLYIHDGSSFLTFNMLPSFVVLPAQRVVAIFCCGQPQVENLDSSLFLIPEIQPINKTIRLYFKKEPRV